MAYSSGGFIWDAAAKKGKSIRIYGEFCRDALAKLESDEQKRKDDRSEAHGGAL